MQDILNFQIAAIAGSPITVSSVLAAIVIILISLAASSIIRRITRRTLAARDIVRTGTVAATNRLLHYAIMLVGLGVALETIGINLTTLFAAGAIFAVGIGFAMQNIAQNFVSGVILLLERTIKPGDVLEVQDSVVRVVKMGIRATLVRTRDDEELIVPNSLLVQSTVKNYTLQDSLYRLRAQVGVVYSSDLNLVKETLERITAEIGWRSRDRAPRILLTDFGDSSVNFEVSVWMHDPWEARPAMSELLMNLWWGLKEVGVVIAFPQLDVHFDNEIQEPLMRMVAARA
ncbi:MAG: mechanosensitive ion channel family protein [Gemmatimonadales bacterium]